MAETSKNKIYYNDNENSVADVLADMKKMAESTDKAIENSKYDDTQIKKDISYAKKEQALKDAEQDNKIIELQNEKAELEKELKEAQEDFYQNSIRGQASGEYIHVEDSSNCRAKIGIGGNSEQETRSGKNKIEITKTTTTVNGCTHTIKDGTDTLSGTSTGWANLIIYSFTGNGKTYTLSGSPQSSKNIFISAHDNTQNKDLATSKNGSTGTFVATNGNSIDIIICVAPNLTLANELFKPQLEEGLKATVWEQGGASPSTDHQSEVESVGSNINIFDKDNPDMFLNRLTPDNAGNIVSTLTDTTKTNYIITIIVPCKGNKQYTISRWLSGKIFIVYESEKNKFNINDKVTLLKRNDNSGIINETIATSANAKYILVKIYSTWGNEENTYNDLISSIKIEKGKVATSYSKYGQGCVKVTKCNKNIFKPEEFSIINQNVTCSYKDGKFTLNGEVTSAFTIDISKHFDFNKIAQLTVNKNVTFSIQKYTGNIDFELNLGSRSSFYILQLRSLKKTKITKNLLEELTRFSLYVGVGKYNNFSFELQLEIGDNQTVSVGPAEQSYIMPTQTEMLENDYLDYDNEEEVHVWKKLVFDGITNRVANRGESNSKTWARFNGNDWDKKSDWVDYENMKCTHFIVNNSLGKGTTYAKFGNNGIMVQFVFNDNNLKTIEDVNNWLKSQYDAGTPVIVYYKQQTPTRLPFTDEQKAVAKELNNARTYKNVTNITTDSKAILSLDYAKDQETQNQKMQNEIDEIKQLLSTTQTSALLLDNMQTDIESEVK